MQDKRLCCPPFFFLGPAVAPHFLNSRIATARQATVTDGCVVLNLLLQLQTRRQLTLARKKLGMVSEICNRQKYG